MLTQNMYGSSMCHTYLIRSLAAMYDTSAQRRQLQILTGIAGELLFGFIEENANKAGTVGGRFINATLTAGQTVVVPQGIKLSLARLYDITVCMLATCLQHAMISVFASTDFPICMCIEPICKQASKQAQLSHACNISILRVNLCRPCSSSSPVPVSAMHNSVLASCYCTCQCN